MLRFLLIITFLLVIEGVPFAQTLSGKSPGELTALLKNSSPDTNRIKLLLQIGKYHLFKSGEFEKDLDSSFSFLWQAKKLSDSIGSVKWQHESLCLIGHCYFESSDVPQGKAYFMQVIKDLTERGDKEKAAQTWARMGNSILHEDKNFPEKINSFEQAALIYRQTKNKEKEIEALKNVADIHLNQGKLNLAESELLEVLNMYKSIGFRRLHYTYDLLSVTGRLKGDFNKALLYALEAVKSIQATGDSSSAGYFYMRVANVYRDLGQTDKSIEWYTKSLAQFQKRNPPDLYMYRIAGYLVRGQVQQGNEKGALAFLLKTTAKFPPVTMLDKQIVARSMGDCYNAMHQYEKAEKYYLEMIEWEERQSGYDEVTAEVYNIIGKFYLDRQRYDRAGYYFTKVLDMPTGITATSIIKDIHLMLFKTDSAVGNYVAAIRHLQQHKALNDSIFNEAKSKQIEELQIQYETAKKEQDIKLLQNERDLQQNKLQNATLTKNLTFGGIALLLIIIGLLLNRYRLKQRSNRKLELQQKEINQQNLSLQNLINQQDKLLEEKEWLLKEVHHRVKNNLQMVMSLLNTQSVYLDNKAAVAAIRDSQHRMQAISLIHKKLYQSDNAALADMPSYINELVHYLQDSFDTGGHIVFEQHIEPVKLDVAQAVPLGIILNEAISNALKYAFPDNRSGTISITLKHTHDNQLLLTITDNGVGLPSNFDVYNSNSLGINLMQGLSKQLNCGFTITSENGVTITVQFTEDKLAAQEPNAERVTSFM